MSTTMPINHLPADRPTDDHRKVLRRRSSRAAIAQRPIRAFVSGVLRCQIASIRGQVADTPDFLSLLRSGFVEARVHDVVEEIEIGRLDVDGRELPPFVVPDPHTQVHLYFVARAAHADRVSHDHLVPFVEERDQLLVRVEHLAERDHAATHCLQTPVGTRQPGRPRQFERDIRPHGLVDDAEVPTDESIHGPGELRLTLLLNPGIDWGRERPSPEPFHEKEIGSGQGDFRTSPNSPVHESVSTVRTCPDRAIDAGPAAPYRRAYVALHPSSVALPTMRPATRARLSLRVRRWAGDRSSRRALPNMPDPPPGVRPEPSSRGGIAALGRKSSGRLNTTIASNGMGERPCS